MLFKDPADSQFQSGKMLSRDGLNGQWVNFAEVIMYENVAKAADISPRDCRLICLVRIGKLLRGLRQRLQVTKRGGVEHFIFQHAPTFFNNPYFLDAVENMHGVCFPAGHQISIASRNTCCWI